MPGAMISHTSKLLPSPNPAWGHQEPPHHSGMEQNIPFLQLLCSQVKPGMRSWASLGLQLQSENQRCWSLAPCCGCATSVSPLCHLNVTLLGQNPAPSRQARLGTGQGCPGPTAFAASLIWNEEPCPAGTTLGWAVPTFAPLGIPGLTKSAPKPRWRGDSELCPSPGWARGESRQRSCRKRQNPPGM